MADADKISEVTITSFRTEIIKSEKKVGPDANIDAENITTRKSSNDDKYHHPYREVYEEKPTVNFLTRVFSMFKSKKDSSPCACCACAYNEEPVKPTKAATEPNSIEPLFQNSNCKSSDTIDKADKTSIQTDNRSNKIRCNTLNRYKCDRCGKIDFDKLDNRCPKLKFEEETLMFLLKLEAKQNSKQIKNIQKQLKEGVERLEDLNRKYLSLVKLISPDKFHKVDTDMSTDTVATRDKEIEATYEITDGCNCEAKYSCICPAKKQSLCSRLFGKSKCDVKCKCCLTPGPDKNKCKFFLEKKSSKKKAKEKDSKTSKGSKKKTKEKKEKKEKKVKIEKK